MPFLFCLSWCRSLCQAQDDASRNCCPGDPKGALGAYNLDLNANSAKLDEAVEMIKFNADRP